jgi:hypothetical protein
MATKQLTAILSTLCLVAGCLSCGYFSNTVPGILELSNQKVTLEEASEITGRPVPVPTYLTAILSRRSTFPPSIW